MSATYTLPGDVIHVKVPVPIQSDDGKGDELAPGYYAVAGQIDEMLILWTIAEDEDDGNCVPWEFAGKIPAALLGTEYVGITYIKVSGWADQS